jgi:hypothetical protein
VEKTGQQMLLRPFDKFPQEKEEKRNIEELRVPEHS